MNSEHGMARFHSCSHCFHPINTPVVALTATATHCVKDRIVHALQMAPVQMITKPGNRPNLRYSVEIVKRDVHVTFKWLILDLKRKRTTLPKVIVFCCSIHTCARLFAMYHSRVGKDEKQQIMQVYSESTWYMSCSVFHHCFWNGCRFSKYSHSYPLRTTGRYG